MNHLDKIILALVCIVGAALLGCPATGAPITGWQPWINLTGFNPSYTEVPLQSDGTLKPEYASLLASLHPRGFRFMDWNQTVGSPLVNWSDRPLADFGATGVSYETSIRVANQFHAEPWFDMPDRSTVDYWGNMGTLLAGKLDKSIPTIRIQAGNEYWNLGDQQQGTSLLLRARANPALAQYSDTERGARELTIETLPKIDALRAKYKAAGGTARVIYEIDGFSPNPYWSFWQADQMKQMGRDPSKMDIRLPVANYIEGSPTDVPISPTDTPAQGLVKLKAFVDTNAQWDAANKGMAVALGLLGTDVYEFRAGTSGGITTGPMLDWWIAFNKSPEARELQHYALTELTGVLGTDAALNLEGVRGIAYSQYGQLSLLDIGQTTSPSYEGVRDMTDFTAPEPCAVTLLLLALCRLAGRASSMRQRHSIRDVYAHRLGQQQFPVLPPMPQSVASCH